MGDVAIVRCASYKPQAVDEAVKTCLDALGGIEKFVKPGMNVAIKPNLLLAKKPEFAATTHPAVVKAVIEAVQAAGGIATIVESPGGPYSNILLKMVYATTGMEQVANETGAKLNFDLRVEKLDHPDGEIVKTLRILKPLAEADMIIDVAKLKTHMMMVYTGAVKNMFGAIAGTEKADFHARMPDYGLFAKAIIDIYQAVKPTICIIDGILGMEGEGPGTGVPRHLGALIAAESGFEADAAASAIIGLKPSQIPVLKAATEQGLLDTSTIRFPLCSIKDLQCLDFDNPALALHESGKTKKNFLERIAQISKPTPFIHQEKCIRCGKCAQACPVKVIKKDENGAFIIHPKACIRCFCCHELCPEKAIEIKRNLVSRFLLNRRNAGYDNDQS